MYHNLPCPYYHYRYHHCYYYHHYYYSYWSNNARPQLEPQITSFERRNINSPNHIRHTWLLHLCKVQAPAEDPWVASLVQRYLSDIASFVLYGTICLIRLIQFATFIHNCWKKTSVRQVVLDKWFPLRPRRPPRRTGGAPCPCCRAAPRARRGCLGRGQTGSMLMGPLHVISFDRLAKKVRPGTLGNIKIG